MENVKTIIKAFVLAALIFAPTLVFAGGTIPGPTTAQVPTPVTAPLGVDPVPAKDPVAPPSIITHHETPGTPPATESSPFVNQGAPAFTATTSNGSTVSLTELRGKIVVLEWTNDGCPFVRKHYGSNNMQTLQKELTAKGVVWAQVISSAPGKQGAVTGAEANQLNLERGAAPTYTFMDTDGKLGKLYHAKTTPHMFVIDTKGTLRYMGAIDSNASPSPNDIPGATNYVRQAVDEILANKNVSVPVTKSYGCAVKYAD